jgi:hypothetical protein
MICDKCKELIGPSAPIYKASRGFLSGDGGFFEDERRREQSVTILTTLLTM